MNYKPSFTLTERFTRTKLFQAQQSFETTSRVDTINSLPNSELITHQTNISNMKVMESPNGSQETRMDLVKKFRSTHGPTFV